jgi:hypothetical protein
MQFVHKHIWWIVGAGFFLLLLYNGNLASFGLPSSILFPPASSTTPA